MYALEMRKTRTNCFQKGSKQMDSHDAVRDIHKLYPTIPEQEIRSAMDAEIDSEEKRLTGRGKYAQAVENAHYRILEWLKNGTEYNVDHSDLDSLCKFLTSHRPACAWAVLRSKQLHKEVAA